MLRITWIAGCFILMAAAAASAQPLATLSLDDAYELLDANYPVLKNSGLLNDIYNLEMNELEKRKLPQLYLKADGRIQSDAVHLDTEGVMLPFEIDQPWYSTKAYAEVQYNFLHSKATKAQRALKTAVLEADRQVLEVDRYALRKRINGLFLGIEMLRQQEALIDISVSDLAVRMEQVEAGVAEGVLLESELKQLEVKELELTALRDNLKYNIAGYQKALAQLTGTELSDDLEILFPEFSDPSTIPDINRPEQDLFKAQREAVLARGELLDAERQPQLGAYAQGGVGYPNPLNFLDEGFAPYGILGMQFSWKITDWGKRKTEKEVLDLKAEQLENAEETFDFNIESSRSLYIAEVARLESLIRQDEAIAALQAEILEQFAAQLDEGVITSFDYVSQVNAELLARQNLSIHKTELLKAQIEFLNERGGF